MCSLQKVGLCLARLRRVVVTRCRCCTGWMLHWLSTTSRPSLRCCTGCRPDMLACFVIEMPGLHLTCLHACNPRGTAGGSLPSARSLQATLRSSRGTSMPPRRMTIRITVKTRTLRVRRCDPPMCDNTLKASHQCAITRLPVACVLFTVVQCVRTVLA